MQPQQFGDHPPSSWVSVSLSFKGRAGLSWGVASGERMAFFYQDFQRFVCLFVFVLRKRFSSQEYLVTDLKHCS